MPNHGDNDEDNREYLVLVNEEGQHSLWPQFREIPLGWSAVGPRGSRNACLDWVEQNWTDMRPKSLVNKRIESTTSNN